MKRTTAFDPIGLFRKPIFARFPFMKKVPPEKKLSREAVISILLHSLFQFSGSMSFVFVNIYLWRLSHQLSVIVIYNLICYLFVPVGFIIGGRIAKRRDRLVTFRIGIGFYALFYLSIVFSGALVSQYYYLFAVFIGLAMGFYWSGILILMFDVTTESNRLRYFSMNTIYFTLAGIAGPAVSGNIINLFNDTKGYLIVFGIALLVFLAVAAGSFQIPEANVRRKKFYLNYAIPLASKHGAWTRSLFGFFIIGLLEGMIFFLPGILLFHSVGREDFLGYLVILFSLISVAAGLIQSRFGTNGSLFLYVFISSSGIVAAALVLMTGYGAWSLIGFMAIYSFFNPWLQNTMLTYYYMVVDRLLLKGRFRVESVVIYECVLNLGRVASIALYGILVLAAQLLSDELYIFLSACTQLLIVFFMDKSLLDQMGEKA